MRKPARRNATQSEILCGKNKKQTNEKEPKMKRVSTLLIMGLSFALSCHNANAQWAQIGPRGATVTDLAVSGNTLYAAAYGGVFVSTDFGFNWTHSNWGFMKGDVRAVAANGSKVFAASRNDTLYSRDVNGLIWEKTSANDIYLNCITVVGNNVFVGSYYHGVFLSTDNGATWTQVNNGLTDHHVDAITAIGSNIFAGTGSGVFMSTDNGSNWTKVSAGLPSTEVISLASNGTDLFAGLWGNPGYTSPNNGDGWLQFGGKGTGYPSYIRDWVFSGSKVYAGTTWIYVTSDAGANWTELSGDDCPYHVNALAMIGPNLVAGTRDSGIYVSPDGGAKWTHVTWGLSNYCMNGVAAAGGNLLAAGSGGMFRSTDDGANWTRRRVGAYEWADLNTVAYRSSTYAFAGDVNGYAYVSSDGGNGWTSGVQIEQGARISSFAFISTYVFAATQPNLAGVAGGVYLSKDNGASWTRVSDGLPTVADTNTYVTSLAVVGSNLFAGTGHGVYMSSNNGTSWTRVSNGLTGQLVYALAARRTELFAGLYNQGVFRSSDNGASWTHTKLVKNITSLCVVDTNVFAGTRGDETYVLANSDSSWRSTGLPGNYVTSFAASNGKLFAATMFNTVWERPISDILTGTNNRTDNVPTAFVLSQNYPNPFNPATMINYQLPMNSHVTLKIYDVLGREVKTLVNERQSAGTHSVRFDGSGLSSGVYFYRLTAGHYSITRKLVLMK